MERTAVIIILACLGGLSMGQNRDSLITEFIEESVIVDGHISYKIDRTTHFFTHEQIKTAREARDVAAMIPELFIDEQGNRLRTINNKDVLVLINGIKSKDSELQLIPPEKIRKIDFYDVPPVKYMDYADVVINVHTRKLDIGWAGTFYARGGQMYSHANASIGYVSGNNKITFELAAHLNQKRKIWDLEDGQYDYHLNGSEFICGYRQLSRDWGNQMSGGLTWLNSKDGNYILQVSASMSGNNDNIRKEREMEYSVDSYTEKRIGNIIDRTQYLSPVMEVYFSKVLSKSSTLTFDLVGTAYFNSQDVASCENYAVNGDEIYTDRLLLDIDKHSLTGEINYQWNRTSHDVGLGYRGTFSRIANESADPGNTASFNTSFHRLYGEYSSRINSFSWRISLGADVNTRTGSADNFSGFAFTPSFLLGYSIKRRHFIRLRMESGTVMPGMQQMSGNRIMVMDGFIRSGNETLRNSTVYKTQLMYSFSTKSKLYLSADAHFNYTSKMIYTDLVRIQDSWCFRPENANRFTEAGMHAAVCYIPWKFMEISFDASAEYQTLVKKAGESPVYNWFFPIYCNLRFMYANCTLAYRHSFGGSSLNGLYLEGMEKVSYISLSYRWRNLNVGLQCLFPFAADKFSSHTTMASPVRHAATTNLRTKNHEFGVTFSWNFVKGKDKEHGKNISNDDYDTGKFEF